MLPKKNSSARINPGSIVLFEQHGQPLLAVALEEQKGKWSLLTQAGKQTNLAAQRIYLIPGRTLDTTGDWEQELDQIRREVDQRAQEASLEDAWRLLLEDKQSCTAESLASLLFEEVGFLEHLTARIVLVEDRVYFKRKAQDFEPRDADSVEKLQHQQAVEHARKQKQEELKKALLARLREPEGELPETISQIEDLAVFGSKAPYAKESSELVLEVIEKAKLPFHGKVQDKAFRLLIKAGHFDNDVDLNLLRLKRPITFSEACLREAEELKDGASSSGDREDLRGLLTISIDGAETKDFDDALSLEKTGEGYRLYIHISDVASQIKPSSILEKEIFRRATSIYCADKNIPMLPRSLSEDYLSLRAGADRLAVTKIVDIHTNGEILERTVKRSVIHVDANLTYSGVNEELYGDRTSERHELLSGLWDLTCIFEARRNERGATQFQRRELVPSLSPDGRVRLEENRDELPANKLVGEMMILANETGANFAAENGIPLLFRSQPPPETVPEVAAKDFAAGPAREYFMRSLLKRSETSTTPQSHFGLGVERYAQLTSPIRRAADFLNQRQIVSTIANSHSHYNAEQLKEHFDLLLGPLDEAQSIQQSRQRYWLLRYFQQEKIQHFDATVVRIDGPKPLAELEVSRTLIPFSPRGKKKLGDFVRLKAEKISPRAEVMRLVEISEE